MKKENLCFATISLVRTEDEERLLRNALTALARLNLPVFVTDGGSPPSFVDFLQSLPNFLVLRAEAKGVFAQARNSLQEAARSGAGFIFYTEPDKKDFFANGLPRMLVETAVDAQTGVVLAARSAKGFATFPPFQQMTETAINRCCAEVMGVTADYCYGPFLLNTNLVERAAGVREDIGWGWRPFVFGTAHRLGLRTGFVEGDFCCPADQRTDDAAERLYRMKQLEQNIRGLVRSKE